MRFALFYEIPVARPWDAQSEHRAYKETLEEAIAGERAGFHAFWTVEHHFLEEYSHCSNPEVLYGAIAARTERMRLGYGVRLMPKPYNHPVRTAESVAVLDLLSDGRVDFGTGRSATRVELEGFGVDPKDTREMWREAIEHVVGCWTNDRYSFEGKHWSLPDRRVQPKPLQSPHPPIFGATTSDDGHQQVGELGLGLCSFAVGVPPEEVKKKVDIYREAIAKCTNPIGKFVNAQAATFTMATCAPTREEAWETARESFEWYPKKGARQIAEVAEWMEERQQELGNYDYAAAMRKTSDDGTLDLLSLEYLASAGACVLGTPDDCVEACRRYEEAGVDLLLCLVNPYKIPHDKVMQTIDLFGTYVIPEFACDGRVMPETFEIICEIEPATRPDLKRVRHQIGVLAPVADAFLVPDNHIGRATVSSVAVAHEVGAMGARAIACLNARDRNVLGMRRDLLTAAAYGVDEFLCVYGDRPAVGARVEQLSVRDMIREVRMFDAGRTFRVAVATGLWKLPAWKQDADSCFVQIGFDLDALLRWRDALTFDGRVYAGVIVLASPAMVRKLASDLPDVTVPDALLERIDRDPRAGVEIACDFVDAVRASGAFDGVHLVPVSRYRETAAALEARRR